jgi:hypothetical protein
MLATSSARIWLYLGIADMRKQFDGLAASAISLGDQPLLA